MLRVASNNSIIIPPFESAWLSLEDHKLDAGSFCLQFECKGDNDVTIILKPVPGAKRWQHLQRQQGPGGGPEQLAVEANYTVILGSHRNSKLKIEKNGEEKAVATGLPGCTVTPSAFTACWINYSAGCIAVGTGPVGSSLSYVWQDAEPAIADIQHIGLSCWDRHVSYRDVQLLPALPPAQLQALQMQLQQQQQAAAAVQQQLQASAQPHSAQQEVLQQLEGVQQAAGCTPTSGAVSIAQALQQQQQQHDRDGHSSKPGAVPSLLQLVQHAIVAQLQPADVCHVLQLSEALLPRTQHLYEQAVQLAGEWFGLLAQQHLQELAMLPQDVLMDVVHEPLLDVSEVAVFQAVAAWCQGGTLMLPASSSEAVAASTQLQEAQQQQQRQQLAAPTAGERESEPASQLSADSQHAEPVQQQPPQQQQQALRQVSPPEQQQRQVASCWRGTDEMLCMLQLVRFALMSDPDRQAVLDHPFTQACPLVQQCLQDDLQRLQEHHSGRAAEPTATEAGFQCQQRRLVLAAAHAPDATAVAGPSDPSCAGTCSGTSKDGSSASTATAAATHTACDATASAAAPAASLSAARAASAGPADMQRQVSTSSAGCRTAGPGWLSRSGSSGSSSSNRPGTGWRSYRRRLAPSCSELMYVCDGDRNGVIHHIATEYGSKPWVNPVLSKALEIKASSPCSRYTDPKALVSGQFLNTSFAGPRYVRLPPSATTSSGTSIGSSSGSGSTPSTWWQLDLGPKHRLLCNYYCIRHDGSHEGFARSWALQGSNDLQHWLDLRRHVDDSTIRLPGQYGSWPVTGPAACMPFRAFRLLLTGPTQSQTNPWAFCLSYWELYGYFYKLRNAGTAGAGESSTALVGRQQ